MFNKLFFGGMMHSLDDLKKQVADLMEMGKYDEALPLFQEILDMGPEDHEAWYYLALAHIELKNYEKAEEALIKALDLDDGNVDYLLQLGYLKHITDDVGASKKIFHQILKIDPINTDALQMLGLIAKDEEQFQEALDFLLSSYENEQDIDILSNIVECYLDLGDLDQAEKYLEELSGADLEPDQAEAEKELAVRFYLDKAMNSWTGTSTGDDNETLYFPETMDQVNSAEYYLQLAADRQPEDEFYIDRIQQLKEVVAINKKDLTKDHNDQPENFTDEDYQAWEILDEIYSLWSDMEVEEGTEYHWPNNLNEVKASRKLLKKAKKIKYSSGEVKDRLKAIEEVLDSSDSWIPNNSIKFFRALAISIAAIVGVFLLLNLQKFKKPEVEFSASDWVVKEKTELLYDAFVKSRGNDLKYHQILAPGAQLTPIASMGSYWAQVETQNSQRGFVNYRRLAGAKHPIVNRNTAIYSNFAQKTVLDSVNTGEKVTVLSYHKSNTENIPYVARVRCSDGKTGYIWDYALDYPFFDALPEIVQTTTFPTSLANIEKLTGKTISDLESKFGPATSIINSQGKKFAYFRQINVVKGEEKFRGIFFQLNNASVVTGHELNYTTKYKFLEKLPLASTIREMELFTVLGFSFYEKEGLKISWWEKFSQMNWFTKIIGFLVKFAIGLTLIFLFFSIPRLIINPVMILTSHTKMLGNGMVLFLNFLFYGFAAYFFFVWMALLMNQIFTPLICAVPTFFIWWYFHRYNINYNRCPRCHTMNVGIDKGSTFHGKTKNITHGTYDVYKGTTETSTQIIKNYERRRKKTTEVVRHYTDHRECINCGYQWGVARDESEGEKTQYL